MGKYTYYDCNDFINNQLNRIQIANEKGVVEFVVVKSFIEESFGRVYIRWIVDIHLKTGWTYDNNNYKSYEIFGKGDNRREVLKHQMDYLGDTFDQYNEDVEKFLQIFTMNFAIPLYVFITDFEFVESDLYYGDLLSFTVINVVDNRFIEVTIKAPNKTEISAVTNEHIRYELQENLEWFIGWKTTYEERRITAADRIKRENENEFEYNCRLKKLMQMSEKEYQEHLDNLRKEYSR